MVLAFLPTVALAAEATLPTEIPAVTLAPLVDHSEDPQADLATSYSYSISDDTAGVKVTFTAEGLKAHQAPASSSYAVGEDTTAYWVGIGICQPEEGVTVKYAYGQGDYAAPSTFDQQPASTYTIEGDTAVYDTFYFNACPDDAAAPRTAWVAAQYSLTDSTGTEPVVFVYLLDFSGVTKYAPPVVEATPTVLEGTATSTVPEDITANIEAAQEEGQNTLTIQATASDGDGATVDTAKVTLPGAVVDALAGAEQVATAIETDLGTITLSNDAITKVKGAVQSGGGSTSDVTLTVGTATAANEDTEAATFEVTVTSGGAEVPVSDLSSPITLAFSFDNSTASIDTPVLAYVNQTEDGVVYERLANTTYDAENGIISGDTSHLSTFAVVPKSATAGAPLASLTVSVGENGLPSAVGTPSGSTVKYAVVTSDPADAIAGWTADTKESDINSALSVNLNASISALDYQSNGKYLVAVAIDENGNATAAGYCVISGLPSDYSITEIGAEQDGGAGLTRTIECSTTVTFDGTQYLVIQITEGSGEDAQVSVVMVEAAASVTVSYKSSAQLYVLITSGMPDLTSGEATGVIIYDSETTANG